MQKLSLIFGQTRGIHGSLQVSPELLLILLQHPFKDWLKYKLWEDYGIKNKQADYDEAIYNVMSMLDEYDDLHPSEFSWQGIRIDYEQSDAAAEIIFTKERIVGEIHLNYHKINHDLFKRVEESRKILNSIQTPFKDSKGD